VVSFTPRPLYHRDKNPRYPLFRGLGGPQNQCRRGGEQKKSLSGRPVNSLVTILTELHRFILTFGSFCFIHSFFLSVFFHCLFKIANSFLKVNLNGFLGAGVRAPVICVYRNAIRLLVIDQMCAICL